MMLEELIIYMRELQFIPYLTRMGELKSWKILVLSNS